MRDYKKYMTCPPAKREDFRLIDQKAVKRCAVPESSKHNAVWDLKAASDGTVYFPLSAEMHFTENVWLYTYDYKTNTVKRLFKLEEKIFCRENAIHASKIHTSISELPDGRLIMTTHTTAQSPLHPTWMPEAYYAHPWEGFEGSNVLIYDPKTGNLENRGKPVPYESIYGGVYSPVGNAFYFTGYIRGHLYRLDLDTNYVHDYGQISEFGSFRVALGPDGNVYCNSRSGIFYKVDTVSKELLDTGHRFPKNTDIKQGINHSQLDYYANYGKKMYLAVVFNAKSSFLIYDTENNTMCMTDTYIPDGANVGSICSPHGMAFDSRGRLWYTIKKYDAILQGCGHLLCSWDIPGGGRPVSYGLVGTLERTNIEVSEIEIHNDIMFLPDANYFFDPSAVMGIDLGVLTDKSERRPYSNDPAAYVYVENAEELYDGDFKKDIQHYLEFMAESEETGEILNKNSFAVDKVLDVVRTWKYMPIEQSRVINVRFENNLVKAVCGLTEYREVSIKDNEVVSVKRIEYNRKHCKVPGELENLDYPCIPGRQYKAVPVVSAKLWDERYIVATEDGIVCIVKGKDVLALGTAIQSCGVVRAFAVSEVRKEVYGIAGGANDCGIIFCYNDKKGLRQLGRAYFNGFEEPGVVSSNELSSIAISDDGTRLIVGASDRLGCVYIYRLDGL